MSVENFDTMASDEQQQAAAEFEQQQSAAEAQQSAEQQASQEQVRTYEYRGERCDEDAIRAKCPYLKNMGEAAFQKVIAAYEVPTIAEPIHEPQAEQTDTAKREKRAEKEKPMPEASQGSVPPSTAEQLIEEVITQAPITTEAGSAQTPDLTIQESSIDKDTVIDAAITAEAPAGGGGASEIQGGSPEQESLEAADVVVAPATTIAAPKTTVESISETISVPVFEQKPVEKRTVIASEHQPVPMPELPVITEFELELPILAPVLYVEAEPSVGLATSDVLEHASYDVLRTETSDELTEPTANVAVDEHEVEFAITEHQPATPEIVVADMAALVEHVGAEAIEIGYPAVLPNEISESVQTFIAAESSVPEQVEHIENLKLLTEAGSSRLLGLALEGQLESVEATQIQIKLEQWYEEILNVLEPDHDKKAAHQKAAHEFVEQLLKEIAQAESQTRTISEDEATHEYKRLFRTAQYISQDALELLKQARLGRRVLLVSGLRATA
jgi:hypothetical protein